MKRFKFLSMVVAVVLAVAAVSCSPVRYDEGYDVGYSSSPVYGVDPYIGYYTPSPYYSAPYYGGTYYGRSLRPNREYRERRDYRRDDNYRQNNTQQQQYNRQQQQQYNRQQNNRVYQNNNQPAEQHYKGNPLLYLQQQKRNNDRH